MTLLFGLYFGDFKLDFLPTFTFKKWAVDKYLWAKAFFEKVVCPLFCSKTGQCPLLKTKVSTRNPLFYWGHGTFAHFPTFFLY